MTEHFRRNIQAIRDGKKTGKYIVVVNHSTKTNFYNERALKNVFRLNLWIFLAAGFVIGFLFFGFGIGAGLIGSMLAAFVWLLVWDFAKLKKFKETIATDVLN